MTRPALHRLPILAGLAGLALLLSSCTNPLYLELTASSFSVQRYADYAPITLYDVTNPSDRPLTGVMITASCTEDQFESLKHRFRSARFEIGPGETIPEVQLEYVEGWPYFTRFRVGCRFDASNDKFPMEPEVVIRLP